MADGEGDTDRRPVDRLTIFSDAVVAIAITLLAIDLPVPEGSTVSQFWTSVRRNSGHYAAFVISFVAIAASWNHHHDMFRYTEKMDSRLRMLNFIWLFTIVLNPFATRLLTSQHNESLAVHAFRYGFYALVLTVSAAALLAMLYHMVTRAQAPGISSSAMTASTWQTSGMMLGFGLSIPVFFATTYGWALWFAVPMATQQVYHFRHKERRQAGAT